MTNKYKQIDELIAKRAVYPGKRNTTGYKGVSVTANAQKPYMSGFQVSHRGKRFQINLGNFTTPEEAYIARIKYIDSLK